MSYTDLIIKQLYGRSYNECNHPECNQVIIAVDPNTYKVINHGEIAHIRGRKAGAERFVEDYPAEKLNSEENLILLCQLHHHTIDQKNAEEYYTIERLEKWKAEHYYSKEALEDREWVYGSSQLSYTIDNMHYTLDYWKDKNGTIRFFTPDQIKQAKAATEISMLFSQIGSLLTLIDNAEGKPADPSHQTSNDSYMRMFKRDVEHLKTGYKSALNRLYENLNKCPDITLSELALVGSTKKMRNTTIMVGESSEERISDFLQNNTEDVDKE